ncbi:MAG: hypothetical protein ACREEW_17110 [Caulobacteraceae bacterium]
MTLTHARRMIAAIENKLRVDLDRGQRIFSEVVFDECHCGGVIVRFAAPEGSFGPPVQAMADTVEMAPTASAWEALEETGDGGVGELGDGRP